MKILAALKNKVVKNASWLIAGKVVQMLISLVVGMWTARYLGPSNYGLINYAAAYTAFFASLCTLGINSIVVKEIIENKQQEGRVLGTALCLQTFSSFLSAITIICLVSIVDSGEKETILVVILSCCGLIFKVFEIFNYWFQSILKSKVTAIVTLISYIITAIYKIYLLIAGKSVKWFALATSVDYILLGILLYIIYKKCGGQKLSFSWKYAKVLLKRSVHFILPGLMVSIYAQTDKLMLKQMVGVEATGYYSTAVALCSMWTFVLAAIVDSMTPSIIHSHKEGTIKFEQNNRVLYAIVFYISIFVSLIFTIGASPIIRLLYGAAYEPSVMPLRIITWYTAFSYLGVARGVWIVCTENQKYLIYIYVAAAVTNVILNLILIPILGTAGAAIASLIAQIVTTLVVPFFIKKIRRNSILMLEAICFKGLLWDRKN